MKPIASVLTNRVVTEVSDKAPILRGARFFQEETVIAGAICFRSEEHVGDGQKIIFAKITSKR